MNWTAIAATFTALDVELAREVRKCEHERRATAAMFEQIWKQINQLNAAVFEPQVKPSVMGSFRKEYLQIGSYGNKFS